MFDFLDTNELRAFISDQSRVLDRFLKGDPETAFRDWAVAMATAIRNAEIELSRRHRRSHEHARSLNNSVACRRRSHNWSRFGFAELATEPQLAERA